MATKKNSSTSSLSPNVAGALSYAPFFGWIAAIVMLIVEKNEGVRWHAVQALVFAAAMLVLRMLVGATVVLAVFVPLLLVAEIVVELVLVVQTYQGKTIKLPLISEWTNKLVKKL